MISSCNAAGVRKTDSVEASNADNTAVGENSRKVRNPHYISQIRICEKHGRSNSFVVFSFTCCPPALFTSVILAFWPTANERKNWRCAGPCWMARKLSANPAHIPRAPVIQTPPNSRADARFARSVGWSAYKSSLLRLAFAYRRPSSQTPHDHREPTVNQAADHFLACPKLRASGNPCLKLLFCLSGNVGAVCRPRNSHPPKWTLTVSTAAPSP